MQSEPCCGEESTLKGLAIGAIRLAFAALELEDPFAIRCNRHAIRCTQHAIRLAFAALELEDPFACLFKKVTVVRNGDHRAGEVVQIGLQPRDRLGVEMISRLIK